MPSIDTNRKNFQAAKERGDIVPAVPVDIPKPVPVATYPVAPNPNLRTPLPAISVQQPDLQRQWQTGATPQQRILPSSLTGNPIVAAQTISNIVAVGTTSSSTPVADVESIAINKQTGTSYTVQVSDLDTLITFNNNSGGTITLPGPSAVFNHIQTVYFGAGSNTAAVTVTNTIRNLMVLIVHDSEGGPVYPVVSDTLGNTWNKIAVTVDDGNTSCSFWYAFNIKGGSNTITVSASTATFILPYLSEYSGFTSSDPLNTFDAQSGGTTALTTGFANCLVYNGILFPAAHSPTIGPGFTLRYSDTLNIVQDQFVASLGTMITGTSVPPPTANGAANFLGSFKTSTGPSSAVFPAGWFTYLENTGTGTFTVTSTALIDGSTQNLLLPPNSGVLVVFDGTDWFTERGVMPITLPVSVANGGTGDITLTAHSVLLGEGTSPIAFAAPGVTGTILTSTGASSNPTFQSPPGAAGTVLTSNGAGFGSTFQTLPAAPTPTVGSNILLGSFTVSDSADQRGNTIFSHIRGRDIMNVAQSYNAKFVFGAGQTAGTVTATSTRVYQMNQVNPSGALFAAYTLSAAANASGGNTVYTGTNLGTLIPGSKLNIAGFATSANNGTGFTVIASSSTTVKVNNPSGVSETHAGTAQLCVLVIGSLTSFPITTVGGAQEVTVALPNLALNSQFDYVVAVYFKTADTSIPVILGVADTLANDGNQLRGATYTGDGTTVAVNGVLPAFTAYPTALLMHQFTVAS